MLKSGKLFDCSLMVYFFYFARLRGSKDLISFQPPSTPYTEICEKEAQIVIRFVIELVVYLLR